MGRGGQNAYAMLLSSFKPIAEVLTQTESLLPFAAVLRMGLVEFLNRLKSERHGKNQDIPLRTLYQMFEDTMYHPMHESVDGTGEDLEGACALPEGNDGTDMEECKRKEPVRTTRGVLNKLLPWSFILSPQKRNGKRS